MSEGNAQTAAVNVETAHVQEPIEITGGSSPVSWDELKAVDNWRKNLSDEPEVKTAQRRAEEGDDLEEALLNKSSKGDKNREKESHEKEKSSKEKASKEKNEITSQAKGKQGKESKDQPKSLKLKHGDQDLSIASDALVTVKVNGESIEVPVQEVVNRYSQQKHLDDLFRQHKTERQDFERNRTQVAEALKKSYEMLVDKQDLKGFAESLAETFGLDGEKIYKSALDKIRQEFEEEATLTPEEYRIRQLEKENELYKSKVEAEKSAKMETAKLKELDSTVSKILTKYKMDKADFIKAYDELVSSPGVDVQELNENPALIAEYHKNMTTFKTVESTMRDVLGDENVDEGVVQKIAKLAILSEANEATIRAAVMEEYGLKPQKQLSDKYKSTRTKNNQTESRVKNAGSDPLTFDDL